MKDKHINDLFNSISPSETQIKNIRTSIIEKSKTTHRYNRTIFPTRKAIIAVGCLAIIAIGAIPLFNNIKTKSITASDTPPITTVSKENKSEFSGFVMTVYAAEKKDTYLSTNYKEENIATVLTPDVKVLLSEFTPLTSTVPGLPFTFDVNKSDSSSVAADNMVITVDNGEFCTWNMETGIVTSEGTSISCKAGDTLYWSPLTLVEGGIVEKAQITVKAMKDGKEIGKQIISIVEIDYNYYAKIGELILM